MNTPSEPNDFNGYINAILEENYNEMDTEEYLKKVYDLFCAKKYTNRDFDNIAKMWYLMYKYDVDIPEFNSKDYLNNALDYYQKAIEKFFGGILLKYHIQVERIRK